LPFLIAEDAIVVIINHLNMCRIASHASCIVKPAPVVVQAVLTIFATLFAGFTVLEKISLLAPLAGFVGFTLLTKFYARVVAKACVNIRHLA
jgi:hypothetical protein